jgi:predicted ATPase
MMQPRDFIFGKPKADHESIRKLCIGFTGSHGSGKTSLIQYTKEKYGFKFALSGLARRVAETEYDNDLELISKNVLEFQTAVISKKIIWERRHKPYGFLTDRTTIDNIAYLVASSDGIPTEALFKYLHRGMEHAQKTYDMIFIVSPLFDIPPDPGRSSDPGSKLRIHYIICGLFSLWPESERHKLRYIHVTDKQTRESVISNYIEEFRYV